VKLSRERAVSLESSSGTEKVLRVRVAGHAVAPTVVADSINEIMSEGAASALDGCGSACRNLIVR
jgi:hypothetical protein